MNRTKKETPSANRHRGFGYEFKEASVSATYSGAGGDRMK